MGEWEEVGLILWFVVFTPNRRQKRIYKLLQFVSWTLLLWREEKKKEEEEEEVGGWVGGGIVGSMAENPVASRPRFFLDEEKNQEFLKTLENGRGGTTRRVHVPPQEERQNAAAVIEAVVDDEEEEDMEVLFSTSTSAPPTQNPKRSSLGVNSEKLASKETLSTIKPLTSWWSRIQDGSSLSFYALVKSNSLPALELC